VSSLTRWVLAHPRIVLAGWVLLTIAGIAASGPATDRLANDSSVPHKEGWETSLAIAKRYGGNPDVSASPWRWPASSSRARVCSNARR
jgi:uncharacterized membrane protein YdfJ with MMPL/SSD domain